jgi:antitoxin component YwqK of YwqJK toxin-antitoxin module
MADTAPESQAHGDHPVSDQPLRASYDDMDINPATYQYLYQGKPFTGEMYEYDTEGTVKAISEFYNGVRRGMSRAYWADGKLQSEARYEYGRPVGVERTWHENGQLAEEITYTDDGTWVSTRRWNEDGTLAYTDGTDEGPRRH